MKQKTSNDIEREIKKNYSYKFPNFDKGYGSLPLEVLDLVVCYSNMLIT